MKCKLPNFMLSLRKISQHINEIVCKWIPLPPLNKEWTDDEVYKYFKFLFIYFIRRRRRKISMLSFASFILEKPNSDDFLPFRDLRLSRLPL